MRAAVLRAPGAPLVAEAVPKPTVRRGELLVRVHATAALPHHRLAFGAHGPFALPSLPTVVGWDTCGAVAEIGEGVTGFSRGDRVYLQPIVTCGQCAGCRRGAPLTCEGFMLLGGFGLGPHSAQMQRRHDGGGFAEYVRAPAANAVRLPDSVSFDDGVRIGFTGISYRALRRGGISVGKSVLIVGATGNLGVPAVGLAAALGADRVFAVARNAERLAALEAWVDDPRVETVSVAAGQLPLDLQIEQRTGGRGVDIVVDLLDASGGATPPDVEVGLRCLAPEGTAVLVGAMFEPIRVDYMALVTHDRALVGSHGYTPAQIHELVAMLESGAFSLPPFGTRAFPLSQVNEALDAVCARPGGFTNVVVHP